MAIDLLSRPSVAATPKPPFAFPWNRIPIRWRIALSCGALLVLIITSLGLLVRQMMSSYLMARTDQALIEEVMEVEFEITRLAATPLFERLHRRFGNDASNEYQVTDPEGRVFFRSVRLGDLVMPVALTPDATRVAHTARLNKGREWRIADQRIMTPAGEWIVQVAASLDPDKAILARLSRILMFMGPLAFATALASGYFLARQALAPIDKMVSATSAVTIRDLDRRLPVGATVDEVSRLAVALNTMIERLHHSFREMQRFTGDAAHELRTPLAIIRNAADVALTESGVPTESRRALEDIVEEVDRLAALSDQLLYLAREDANLQLGARERLRLDSLLSDVVDHLRVVAEDKGIAMETNRLDPTYVEADPDRIRRVAVNVLDNAIKYTGAGGRITVNVRSEGELAIISVSDTGVGIPPEHLPHIFERFYRADPARGDEIRGTGLGLAICKSTVAALGGEILAKSEQGAGAVIEVRLPLAA